MKNKALSTFAVTLSAVVLVMSPGIAQADELVNEYSVSNGADGYNSTLTLEYDAPISKTEAAKEVKEIVGEAGPATISPQAGKVAVRKCNVMFSQKDSKGNMSIQHKCKSSKSPWGFTLNKNLQKVITSKVDESGMSAKVNGKDLGKQADHNVAKNYFFHGTFTSKDNQTIDWRDTFKFKVKGKSKITTLTIGGRVKFTA